MATGSLTYYLALGAILLANTPLGVPPKQEDPRIALEAPAECLFYYSWAGIGEPDAKAANHTEQLFAEEDITRLAAQLDRVLTNFCQTPAAGRPPMLKVVPDLVKPLLTEPWALAVTNFEQAAGGSPTFEATWTINLGPRLEKTRAAIDELLAAASPDIKQSGSGKTKVFETNLSGTEIAWTFDETYLRVAVGKNARTRLKPTESKTPPTWLADVRKQLPVSRLASVMYVNTAEIIKRVGEQSQDKAVIAKFELGRLRYYAAVSGLDDQGFINQSVLATEGGTAGPFGFISAKPLTADDLRVVPADSLFAAAAKLDIADTIDRLKTLLATYNPQAGAQLDAGIAQFERTLGIDLRRDLLQSLGDTWTIHSAAGSGALVFPGLTMTVSVRDFDRLAATHDKLREFAEAALAHSAKQNPGQPGPTIRRLRHRKHDVFYVDNIASEVPFAPAWCLTESHLIVGLYPRSVTSLLSMTGADKNLATSPQVAPLVKGESQTVAFAYYDAPRLWEQYYPLAQFTAQVMLNKARAEGTLQGLADEFTIASFPSTSAVGRHLRPGVAAVQLDKAGLRTVSRQSLPGPSLFDPTTGGLMMAMMFPALASTMDAVNVNRSLNNISTMSKGIAVAIANDGKYPAAYSADAKGQPLLSWRVHLLPHLGEAALYKEFRLNEPWNSRHNAALIERMPKFYRAPRSNARNGLTTYLGVRGKNAVFVDHATRRSAPEITDGESRTATIVEVADEFAVPWTSPSDLDVEDVTMLSATLFGREKGTGMGFADGHTEHVPSNVPERVLRPLFTIDGGD